MPLRALGSEPSVATITPHPHESLIRNVLGSVKLSVWLTERTYHFLIFPNPHFMYISSVFMILYCKDTTFF